MKLTPDASPHPRYRLLELIGKGGMGEVFRAHDRLTGQMVALKRISLPLLATAAAPPDSGLGQAGLAPTAALDRQAPAADRLAPALAGPTTVSDPELLPVMRAPARDSALASSVANLMGSAALPVKAWDAGLAVTEPAPSRGRHSRRLHLTQEFRTLAGLRHPHIVSVFNYGFDSSQQPYYTMELLDGAKRLDQAAKGQSLSTQVGLVLQILQALTYLHRHGVLHCDLKPANIIVSAGPRGPQVKLLDFGLALFTQGLYDQRAQVAGTLGYIAPEVLVGSQVSESSDLFAVGVIAHELLIGTHPLGQASTTELIRRFIEPGPIFHEDVRISPALSSVLRRALARSPGERYYDAAAFSCDLARAAGLAPPAETHEIRESFLQAARFQGRDAELQALLAALRQAMHGRGKVLLIGGESGVGKSRLLEEFRAQALVRGARVLSGQAVQEGGGAFLVLRDVLALLCLDRPLDDLESGVLVPLIPRLPVLLERTVAPAPELDAKSTQQRALAVIEQLLLRAAATDSQPLVLLLEDLQWAGAEVLLLLERLGEIAESHPLLILASYRDDERPQLPAAVPSASVLKLRRFNRESAAAMAEAMLGPVRLRQELVDRLYQETEGNALFIVEVMRALAEAAGQLAEIGVQALPAYVAAGGVRQVIENRLGRVPLWARPLLEYAAVAGRQLDLLVLGNSSAAQAASFVSVESWLAVCAELSILEVSEQNWRFSHDKLRDCLLDQAAKRRELPLLHRQVALAIERSYGDKERGLHAAELAFHYGNAGDAQQAAYYGLQAGERAFKGGALEDAVTQLQATLRYQAACATSLLDGVFARRWLGTALYALGRMDQCVNTVLDLHAFVGHDLPPHPAGQVGVMLRTLIIGAARKVIPAVRLTPELTRPLVRELELSTIQTGVAFSFHGRVADAFILALVQNVLAKQAGIDDSELLYAGLRNIVVSLLPLGPLHRGTPIALPEAVPSFPEAYRFNLLMGCTINVGLGYWEHARRAEALGIELARATGDSQLYMNFRTPMMLAAQYAGYFDKARARASELQALAERDKNALFMNWSRMCLAYLELVSAQPSAALERLHTLHKAASGIGDKSGVMAAMGLLAQACLGVGDSSQARHWAEQALELAHSGPISGLGVYDGCLAPAEVLCALAAEEKEPQQRRHLLKLAGRALVPAWQYAMVFPIGRPRAALAFGRYARLRDQEWLARRLFDWSLAAARKLAMPYQAERAQSALSSLAAAPP